MLSDIYCGTTHYIYTNYTERESPRLRQSTQHSLPPARVRRNAVNGPRHHINFCLYFILWHSSRRVRSSKEDAQRSITSQRRMAIHGRMRYGHHHVYTEEIDDVIVAGAVKEDTGTQQGTEHSEQRSIRHATSTIMTDYCCCGLVQCQPMRYETNQTALMPVIFCGEKEGELNTITKLRSRIRTKKVGHRSSRYEK